jgi:hypothetical protein
MARPPTKWRTIARSARKQARTAAIGKARLRSSSGRADPTPKLVRLKFVSLSKGNPGLGSYLTRPIGLGVGPGLGYSRRKWPGRVDKIAKMVV